MWCALSFFPYWEFDFMLPPGLWGTISRNHLLTQSPQVKIIQLDNPESRVKNEQRLCEVLKLVRRSLLSIFIIIISNSVIHIKHSLSLIV